MSHTDKDRPHFVRLRDPHTPTVEVHFHHAAIWRSSTRHNPGNVCTLHEFDTHPNPRETQWMYPCDREIAYWAAGGRLYGRVPARQPHNPNRALTRDLLRDAAKQHRAGADLDDFDLWTNDFENDWS